MTAAQLLYLAIGFSAMRPYPDPTIPNPNLFWYFGLKDPLQVSEMEAMMYISLSWSGFYTLLSARNEGPFWTSLPGIHLCVAACLSFGATALLGGLIQSDSISFYACPIGYIGVTFLYDLTMFFVLDFVKVSTHHVSWLSPLVITPRLRQGELVRPAS